MNIFKILSWELRAWEQIRVVPILNSDVSKSRTDCTFMPISQQPLLGFSPDFEGRWVSISSTCSNIYMILHNFMEGQESEHAVVTLTISFCGNNVGCPALFKLYLNNHCTDSH